MQAKTTVKVSYKDETKRFKVKRSFEELMAITVRSFEDLPKVFKYYYLDEDFEVISVSSDEDLIEVLDSEQKGIVKLVVARNQSEAMEFFTAKLEESSSVRLRSEFSEMQIQPSATVKPLKLEELDFEKISHRNLADSFVVDEEQKDILQRSQTERVQSNADVKMIETCASSNDVQESAMKKREPIVKDERKKEVRVAGDDGDREMTIEDIRNEIRNICKPAFEEMLIDHINTKREVQGKVVHEGIVCDGCEASPIVGIRYKCTVQDDYDICEVCERNGVNIQNTMIKIRDPRQAPAKIVAQYGNPLPKLAVQAFKSLDLMKNLDIGSFMPQRPKRNQEAPRYSARFVKESFPDKHQVFAGETHSKSWTFRNDGSVAWPEDVILCQTTGDQIDASLDAVKCKVMPESEWTFTVNFTAPKLPGRYTSFFRLQSGNIKFGHKVQIDIMVTEPPKDVDEPMQLLDEIEEKKGDFDEPMDNDVGMTKLSPENPPAIPSIVEIQKPKPDDLAQSMISLQNVDVKSPKQIYFDKVLGLEDSQLKEKLINLYEFGFVSFETNKFLLEKYGDLETVINMLLSGALNESAIDGLYKNCNQ